MPLQNGLEFAPGTSDDSKRLIGRILTPGEILGAYKQARTMYHTGDLVLSTTLDDTELKVWPRPKYIEEQRLLMTEQYGVAKASKMMSVLAIARQSAHQIAKLPFESDAMWVVILRGKELPVQAVIYATPYETGTVEEPNIGTVAPDLVN
jgi:hypothetical protein